MIRWDHRNFCTTILKISIYLIFILGMKLFMTQIHFSGQGYGNSASKSQRYLMQLNVGSNIESTLMVLSCSHLIILRVAEDTTKYKHCSLNFFFSEIRQCSSWIVQETALIFCKLNCRLMHSLHVQLNQELRSGHVFEGWKEGVINFPPTYKYEINSDRYFGENPKEGEKKRSPAW